MRKVGIRGIITALVLLTIGMPLASCGTQKGIGSTIDHDTTYIYRTDSLHTTDSIIVERQTIIRVADSALLAKLGLKLEDNERVILVLKKEIERLSSSKEHVRVDTTYIFKEVPKDVIVEKEVEKPLSWWQKTLMWLGAIAIIAALGVIVWKTKKWWIKFI